MITFPRNLPTQTQIAAGIRSGTNYNRIFNHCGPLDKLGHMRVVRQQHHILLVMENHESRHIWEEILRHLLKRPHKIAHLHNNATLVIMYTVFIRPDL